jgi:hypothetical protein
MTDRIAMSPIKLLNRTGEGGRVATAGWPRLPRGRNTSVWPPAPELESELRAFLDGRTHGEGLLHALYDHVLDEPVPQRLRNILNEAEPLTSADAAPPG